MRFLTILILAFVPLCSLCAQSNHSVVESKADNAEAPRLIVNIVVSQMRYDFISRFEKGFGEGGFKRFMREGTSYEESYYNYMITTTPASLATMTTGANPSIHGVTSNYWIDYTTGRKVALIDDRSMRGLDCDDGRGCYSNGNLVVPTFADALKDYSPNSRVLTIACDPMSAVVMGGQTSDVYWIDDSRCSWATSTAYKPMLPGWVSDYNDERYNASFLNYKWTLLNDKDIYVNRRYSRLEPVNATEPAPKKRGLLSRMFTKQVISRDYDKILTTPAGNTIVFEFARRALIHEQLGRDEVTDVLNICLDAPRYIGEMYGPESMEVEDMFYRLDADLEEFLGFVFAQADKPEDVLVVLTSDHGSSDSYDLGDEPRERFNPRQFCVILNSFMIAQWGAGDWVVDYVDRQLFLNRNLIYSKNLNLEEVQNRIAAFALQFRGISHVITSTAMQNSYFGASYAQMMQNSFYPRRSGDLTINLMAGWIEEREDDEARSRSGSMYGYDTHVPMMWLGWNVPAGRKVYRSVDMCSLAPTLARIVRIGRPIASTSLPLEEIIDAK